MCTKTKKDTFQQKKRQVTQEDTYLGSLLNEGEVEPVGTTLNEGCALVEGTELIEG